VRADTAEAGTARGGSGGGVGNMAGTPPVAVAAVAMPSSAASISTRRAGLIFK